MLKNTTEFSVNQNIQYSNIRLIGRGTNGVVYYAHRKDGLIVKEVALKILPIKEGEDVKQIVREAALVSKINHANIVFVNTTFIIEKHIYIEYDFVDGLSLNQYIGNQKKMSFKQPVKLATRNNSNLSPVSEYFAYCSLIVLQILNGLRAAYEEIDFETGEPLKIVHRDLCPSNIMLSRYGIVKITDFGLAYKKDAVTADQIVIGKLAYCSPEQLKGKGHGYDESKGIVHQTTDIFSVGAIFYELVTQRCLFPLEEMNIAMKKIHSHEGYIELRRHLVENLDFDPSHFNHEVPPELCEVIKKALKINPKKRYQLYQDMVDDISNFMYSLDNRFSVWNLKNELDYLVETTPPTEPYAETVVLPKKYHHRSKK